MAFTHSSWVERRQTSYERLEFLGDSVLGLAIAQHLYERFPDRPEGDLAKVRAQVVSRTSCAVVARKLGLDRDLAEEGERVGAEEVEALIRSQSVVAATVEAVIGAVFIDSGFDRTAAAVVAAFADRVDYVLQRHVDHKTGAAGATGTSGGICNVCRDRHFGSTSPAVVHDGGDGGGTRTRTGLGVEQEGFRAGRRPRGAGEYRPDPLRFVSEEHPNSRVQVVSRRSVELQFHEGIAVIVGPNGSGKSNIADALQWAMATQAPASCALRCGQDVLFSGSDARPPAGVCEVELVLDEARGTLPLEFDEVSVMRRLHREREGEYFINRARCEAGSAGAAWPIPALAARCTR